MRERGRERERERDREEEEESESESFESERSEELKIDEFFRCFEGRDREGVRALRRGGVAAAKGGSLIGNEQQLAFAHDNVVRRRRR